MKKNKRILTLVFLTLLYIMPVFMAHSYNRTVTLGEPNLVKEFSLSSEPWYDSGYWYRQSISIDGATGAGSDYQVMIDVTYDAHMQSDFDDILFTDNDKITVLDFWLEIYVVSTSAKFWVKVDDSLETSALIYMYYGNSTVSTTSDGEATFLLFDDFDDASFDTAKWDVKNNAPVEAGGVITCADTQGEGFASDNSFTYGKIRSNVSLNSDVTGTYFGKWGFLGEWSGADTASTSFWVHDVDSILARTTSDSIDIGDYVDDFYIWEIRWTEDNAEYLRDDSGILTLTVGVHNGPSYASGYLHDKDGATIVDWLFVGKQSPNEPMVASFGDEETAPDMPYWHVVATVYFWFTIDINEWGMNTALIILGLVMIPTSGLYLAYGVKHDRSSDRLFYGLIIFLLGCGLFVGGILPP